MARRGRFAGALVALALIALLGAGPHAARANELIEIEIPARNGEVPDPWLPGYANPPRAKVLLPDGYDPAKRYPLLVLLAGATSSYRTWSGEKLGRIETTAAGFPGIIVMPEGATGYYMDWWNSGRRGPPLWESYYLDQVIPQVLERFPIRPERRYHALAGVSMGGMGTAYLAGRLPGSFGSIAIISGVVDFHLYPTMVNIASLVPNTAGQPSDANSVFGPEDGFYAWGHDPMRLAANLQHTRVFMATGNGVPTDDGEPLANTPVTDIPAETLLVKPSSDNYAGALKAAGVDYTYQVHDGIHDFANFRRELRDAIAWGLFEPVDDDPSSWVNDTVATRGELWGFGYRFDNPPDRIVRFRRSGDRLEVSAAGTPVEITRDGCEFRIQTPGAITVPVQPCAERRAGPETRDKQKLSLKVRPRALRAGRPTRVRVVVRPVVAKALVRSGRVKAKANRKGVARLRLCARRGRRIAVRAKAPGYIGARVRLKVRGSRAAACPGRGPGRQALRSKRGLNISQQSQAPARAMAAAAAKPAA